MLAKSFAEPLTNNGAHPPSSSHIPPPCGPVPALWKPHLSSPTASGVSEEVGRICLKVRRSEIPTAPPSDLDIQSIEGCTRSDHVSRPTTQHREREAKMCAGIGIERTIRKGLLGRNRRDLCSGSQAGLCCCPGGTGNTLLCDSCLHHNCQPAASAHPSSHIHFRPRYRKCRARGVGQRW